MSLPAIEIFGRRVGPGEPCLVIAEAGVNHNGSLDMARKLIDVACEAGADVVKFQTFDSEKVVTAGAPKANYAKETTDTSESFLDMMRSIELKPEQHPILMDYCRSKGILFLSSPFDEGSADLLSDLGVAAYKMPSGEITNLPFLAHVARKGKPMIVSTGMSNLGEVEAAVRVIHDAGNDQIILLQCVSNYPADPADANLRAMATMAAAFNTPVGYSDHTLGVEVALAAVALGASTIEKHLTLDRTLPGPDHRASVEPDEMKSLVRGLRTVESALGHGRKVAAESEQNTASVARKSIVAARHITAGSTLSEDDIAIKRPGTGLSPSLREFVIGKTVRADVPEGALITLETLA